MKVLWTCNIIPGEMLSRLGDRSEVMGGWIESMAAQLNTCGRDISLAITCKCDKGEVFHEKVGRTEYYSLTPSEPGYDGLYSRCLETLEEYKPDIVQIEGTEFLHSKAMLFAAKSKNVPAVVSLQGILNGQYGYQCGQLQVDDLMLSTSPSKLFAGWFMHLRKTRWFGPRLVAEREIIENADYILGRTTWDRAHSYALNQKAKYYKCSRVLRDPFYKTDWEIEEIERHSIYTGSGYTALKGLHYLIMALPQLAREYPDVKVYVAGFPPFDDGGKRPFYKKGYSAYLKKLIEELQVGDRVVFTGTIPAGEVAQRLRRSHVYVLTSCIENSPNTLGEAMTVGVPCVAACVGGVPDMATDGEEALLFRNDDPALLAWNVKRIFDDDELARRLSANAKKRAAVTHDPKENLRLLLECYDDILSCRR